MKHKKSSGVLEQVNLVCAKVYHICSNRWYEVNTVNILQFGQFLIQNSLETSQACCWVCAAVQILLGRMELRFTLHGTYICLSCSKIHKFQTDLVPQNHMVISANPFCLLVKLGNYYLHSYTTIVGYINHHQNFIALEHLLDPKKENSLPTSFNSHFLRTLLNFRATVGKQTMIFANGDLPQKNHLKQIPSHRIYQHLSSGFGGQACSTFSSCIEGIVS